MLLPGIHDAYVQGVDGLMQSSKAREVAGVDGRREA